MKVISKALFAVLAVAVLSAGVMAESMPLSMSPFEKAAPCHRHNQPTRLPSSHHCCQSAPASAIVKTAREEAPTAAAVIERAVFEKLAATRSVLNLRLDQVRPGESPGITPLRI